MTGTVWWIWSCIVLISDKLKSLLLVHRTLLMVDWSVTYSWHFRLWHVLCCIYWLSTAFGSLNQILIGKFGHTIYNTFVISRFGFIFTGFACLYKLWKVLSAEVVTRFVHFFFLNNLHFYDIDPVGFFQWLVYHIFSVVKAEAVLSLS